MSARPAVAASCFHCGLPVADPRRWRADLLGAAREFCCAGCAAVASTIVAGGFERYYATRAGSAARLENPAAASIYDDPQASCAVGPDERGATLILDGIRCAACLWLIEQALRRVPGVLRAELNYTTHRAVIAWDPRRARLSSIIEAIRAVGYDAFPYDPQRQSVLERDARRRALWRLFVAGFGAMQVMMYAFPAYLDGGEGTLSREAENLMRWASLLLTLPVLVFSCGPFFSGAWRELARLRPGMDTPIALGIAAGFAASAWATLAGSGTVYFDSIAMLAFLLLGARYLELVARQRAARALERLARWSPSFALRLAGEATQRVAAHDLAPGDRVLVPPGERIPADGVVESGQSSVDESLLTGESRPLARAPGGLVVGGSTNLEQALVLRVTRAGAQTQAAALARLVEGAAAAKPRLVAAAERLAEPVAWLVLLTAVAAALAQGNPWIAVAVLVAACPCALALASPIAQANASAGLLARGIALTRAGALERLARVTDIVLDKTGTLTEGRFSIARTERLGSAPEAECLALASALEAASAHPLARAFRSGRAPAALEVKHVGGQGIEGRVGGRLLRVGTEAFCREIAPARAYGRAGAGATPIWLAAEGEILAVIHLEDPPRAEAARALAALRRQGLRLHVLSGDHPDTVAALAARLGIDTYLGGATPEDKLAYVAQLQAAGRVVAMVGDGLNDTPVLARADVGLAMGGGAEAAQRGADLVLVKDSLDEIGPALRLARHALGIVRQNLLWALAYNTLALPLAAAGWVGPLEAAIGMAASSFIVVFNAMRLAVDPGQKASRTGMVQSPETN